MATVHFLSLNVRGFRRLDKQREVMHFAKSRHVDILFLQECNFKTPFDVQSFCSLFGVEAFFSLTDSNMCGVGVVFMTPALRQGAHCVFGFDGRTLAVDFNLHGRRVRALVVYAPAQRAGSAEFFDSLDSFMFDSYPTFLVGDFNCVEDTDRDARGRRQSRQYSGARALRQLIRNFKLRDAWVDTHGNDFVATWQRGSNMSRLDRFYFPETLATHVLSCEVLNFPPDVPRITDHFPVSAKLFFQQSATFRHHWKMDTTLIHDPESVALLRIALEQVCDCPPEPRNWDALKNRWRTELIKAGRERKARLTTEINDTLRKARIVRRGETLTFAMHDYLDQLKARYELLLRLSSRTAAQSFINGRPVSDPAVLRSVRNGSLGEQMHVPFVELPNGEQSKRAEDIMRVFETHFSNLFTAEHSSDVNHTTTVNEFCAGISRIPEELRDGLCGPVTFEELRFVLQHMNTTAAAGPDGLPLSFYKTFFDKIHVHLLIMLNGLLAEGIRPDTFRESRVILLFKSGGEPSDPKAWRPISLLNSDYKILAAILAHRITTVLPEIISDIQTCCVPGRTIYSSLALTRDLFTYATRTQISGIFVSLDQEKAFDRVEWNYLFAVLECYGFPARLTEVLRLLYTDLEASLVVNGYTSEPIAVSRGIRQGCPLSAILFVLCIEPLLQQIQRCTSIRGFPLPGLGEVKVAAYADDISLFIRNIDSYRAFLRIFHTYSYLSGARLNPGKSKALCFGVHIEEFPDGVQIVQGVKVLGVTFLATGEVDRTTWKEIQRKVDRRIEIARTFHLPFTERAYLIKSSITAPLLYVARIARPPRRVLVRVATACGSFFWDGHAEAVARALVRLPVKWGGLSIPNLDVTCRMLALKNTWALLENSSYRGRQLVVYLLGTSRRFFGLTNEKGPAAEQPPAYYTHVIKSLQQWRNDFPVEELMEMSPTDLSEQIAFKSLTDEQRRKCRARRRWAFRNTSLPAEARDFTWLREWEALPTADRLAAWGVAPSATCPQCGRVETLHHVFHECIVARTFWRLVTSMFQISMQWKSRHRDIFVELLMAIGAFVLWKRRGLAHLRGRPQRAMFPLLHRLRNVMLMHLNEELVILGEEAFLRRWSTRFIIVKNNRVSMPFLPY